MKNLLNKELKLAASPLSYFFIAFAAMTMIPGYPILVGAFFVCFGIFQTFQSGRENNDTMYTALLPIRKKNVVSARYIYILTIEGFAFLINAALTLVRMTVLSDAAPYVSNAMMNANLIYLGYVLLVYGVFNFFFVAQFYKTAYAIGKPFLIFGSLSFVIIAAGETMHHIPGCSWMNVTGAEQMVGQIWMLAAGAAVFVFLTVIGWKISQKRFEEIDL